MDPLTHTLTGLALSRAGLNRFHRWATPFLLLTSNAPDIDIVSAFGGNFNYFHYHRWLTHSLAGAPVLAAVSALLFCAFERSFRSFRVLFGLAMAAISSHLLLDWTNAYGVRFLLPFNEHWFSLDVTNVVDIWIWAVLLVAALGPVVSRLVSAEIGARPGAGRGMAIAALALVALYDGGRGLLHSRAVQTLESRIYDGETPVRAGAFPTAANPLLWDGAVETTDEVRRYRFSLSKNFDPYSGEVFHKPETVPTIAAARNTPMFRIFLNFSKYPSWRVTPAAQAENTTEVEVVDMRFGFSVTAIVDAANRVLSTKFRFSSPTVSVLRL